MSTRRIATRHKVSDYERGLECALELLYARHGTSDLSDESRQLVDQALEQVWARRRRDACDGNAEQAAAVGRMLEAAT